MSIKLSAEKIFKMAMEIEANGAQFYKDAARKVDGKAEKEFLISLARMEEEHGTLFGDILGLFNDDGSDSGDDHDDALIYLKALADTKMFFKTDPPGSTMEEILHSAIKAEQDSVIFYLGLMDMLSDQKDKRRVDAIIREEMEHIKQLSLKAAELGI
ncbi:MAG: ferritin family protein [Desulfamplus sp.]|nr:ferritin family protein [Desulfamplus sp.]